MGWISIHGTQREGKRYGCFGNFMYKMLASHFNDSDQTAGHSNLVYRTIKREGYMRHLNKVNINSDINMTLYTSQITSALSNSVGI